MLAGIRNLLAGVQRTHIDTHANKYKSYVDARASQHEQHEPLEPGYLYKGILYAGARPLVSHYQRYEPLRQGNNVVKPAPSIQD